MLKSFKDDLENYWNYVKKMHSANTLRAYRRDLRDFADFIESKGGF